MAMRLRFIKLASLLLGGALASSAVVAEPLLPLRYGDREVDLHPYYYAFPYNIVAASGWE